jgi:hypothetical protein
MVKKRRPPPSSQTLGSVRVDSQVNKGHPNGVSKAAFSASWRGGASASQVCLRELPRDFIGHIRELRAGLRTSLMDQPPEYVIAGFIALNFILLAMATAAGLFTVDAVFVLVLLQLAATAALLAKSES